MSRAPAPGAAVGKFWAASPGSSALQEMNLIVWTIPWATQERSSAPWGLEGALAALICWNKNSVKTQSFKKRLRKMISWTLLCKGTWESVLERENKRNIKKWSFSKGKRSIPMSSVRTWKSWTQTSVAVERRGCFFSCMRAWALAQAGGGVCLPCV